jgi:SAM-dependent methyltransferase
MSGQHPPHHSQKSDGHAPDPDDQAEMLDLDLDAEVLAEHTAALMSWLPVDVPPRRVVDLGCGTGTGTFAVLDRFPEVQITAVDASVEHLQRVRDRACARGQDDRVRTVQADLDDPHWPDLGVADLVWASASMHHLDHPDHALRAVHELLAPRGLFVVVEPDGVPRFLPENAPEGRPGLEGRCHEVADRLHADRVPHRDADWGPKLSASGFTLEGKRTITIDVAGGRNPTVGAYALATLRRFRDVVADALPVEDVEALDALLDVHGPASILHRDDLVVRTERRVWAARRSH